MRRGCDDITIGQVSNDSIFEPDLIRRYDQDGPRYTSYPTAPQFTEEFGESRLREYARRSNDALIPSPLSAYVHIPYCFSPCFYCGCNRLITRDPVKGELYLERLLREIERAAPLFDRDRELVQLHLGGGTPNFLGTGQLAQLYGSIARQFNISPSEDRDISIELDPRTIGAEGVAALAEIGFNRASLGVQDFNPDVQAAINREQSVEKTLEVIEACRANGFRSLNVDLVYGLPRQTVTEFRRTLEIVIAARPDRLAIYGYAHLPGVFKAQRQIDEDELPDAEGRLQLLIAAVEMLASAGYLHIGMDHFALPDDPLALAQANGSLHRNFMGYTTHAECDLIGFGVSSISHIESSYSQNHRLLADWQAAIDDGRLPAWRGLAMSYDDEIRAFLIDRLMCHGGVAKESIERLFGIDFAAYFREDLERLDPLAADGLVQVDSNGIQVTSRGRYLLRIIAMCFDRYLHNPTREQGQYSKAI